VTFGNGPFIQRILLDDSKKVVRTMASVGEALDQIVTDSGVALCGKHSASLST